MNAYQLGFELGLVKGAQDPVSEAYLAARREADAALRATRSGTKPAGPTPFQRFKENPPPSDAPAKQVYRATGRTGNWAGSGAS